MEPAVGWREHDEPCIAGWLVARLAAMEPAGAREQFRALDALWENNGMPQWSPLVNTREHFRRVGGDVRQPVAAMEPAAERQEHCPWGSRSRPGR